MEIRRASWGDVLINRDIGVIAGLLATFGMCTALFIKGLLISPLVVGAVGILALPPLLVARIARAESRSAPQSSEPIPRMPDAG